MTLGQPSPPPDGDPEDGPGPVVDARPNPGDVPAVGDGEADSEADSEADRGPADSAPGPGTGDDGGDGEEAGPPLPPIADALLGPLFDSAGEAMRGLRPVDLPPAARRLRGFDRRGLATPAARLQLRRLLESDETLLAAAAAVLLARPEPARLAAAWDEAVAAGGDAPLGLVGEAAGDGRLPLLASVLTAGLPDGVEFGLGLVVATTAIGEREADAAEAVRAAAAGRATAEEAQRRAEAARSTAETEAARLDAALREERRTRRQREQDADDTAAGSEARRTELEAALTAAGQRVAVAERRMAAAEQRMAAAEQGHAAAGQRVVATEQRMAAAEQGLAAAEQRAAAADQRAAAAERLAGDAARRAAAAEGRAGAAEARTAAAERAAGAETGARPTARPPLWPEEGSATLASSHEEDRTTLERIARAAEDLAAGLRHLADG
ncbi:MAG: hypothetical protein QOE80_4501, partial [Actinomycetota bacterium]|nr:hypothetical protein [Actinomycetota bacterium]